jgi:NAD(P)-dependent dehydrogenase (short-subunit alcohol dehydrogenase family)
VLCADVNEAAAKETAAIIAEEGGEARAIRADVTSHDDVRRMVTACRDAYGRIDVLDYNVGLVHVGGVVELQEEDWDRLFAVNLKGCYLTMKHVIPIMEEQGGGSIINISSIAGIRYTGVPYATYYATKAAMNHLTRTTAAHYAPEADPGECRPARPHEDPDGREIGRTGRRIRQGRRRGDVAGARRPMPDGSHGRRLGRRLRLPLPRFGRIEIRHRHRTGRRRRNHAEVRLRGAGQRKHDP